MCSLVLVCLCFCAKGYLSAGTSLQVLRVDYPLPNTGLKYSDKGVVRGKKWWNRAGSAGTSPKKAAALQQSSSVAPAPTGSQPVKAQAAVASQKVMGSLL